MRKDIIYTVFIGIFWLNIQSPVNDDLLRKVRVPNILEEEAYYKVTELRNRGYEVKKITLKGIVKKEAIPKGR